MKKEELRIGNLIFYKGEIIPVTMVGLFGIQSDTKGRHINAKFSTGYLKPIPLSEEVLLKCGFTIHPNGYISHEELSRIECEYIEVIMNTKSHIVEHLHQLQNLYYALTGEELEVTLLF